MTAGVALVAGVVPVVVVVVTVVVGGGSPGPGVEGGAGVASRMVARRRRV